MIVLILPLSAIVVLASFWYMRQFFRLLPTAIYYHLLLISALLFYSGIGVIISYTMLDKRHLDRVLLSSRADDGHVVYALILTLLFSMFVNFVAMKQARVLTTPSPPLMKTLREMSESTVQFGVISFLILSLYGYLILSHKIGLEGLQVSTEDPHVDPLAWICQPLIYIMPILCGYRITAKKNLWLTVPIFLASAAFVLIQGRRNFVILLFLCIFGLVMNRKIRYAKSTTAATLAMLLALGVVGWIAFYSCRLAYVQTKSTDIGIIVSRAYEILTTDSQKPKNDAVGQTKANLTTRAFGPIAFLARVTNSDTNLYGGGAVMQNALISATPSVLLPEKSQNSKSMLEYRVTNRILRLEGPNVDSAVTVLSAAYTDFREVGLPIYAFFTLGVLSIVLYISRRTMTPIVRVSVVTAILLTVLNVQSTTASWFLMLREVLSLFLIDCCLRPFQFRPRPVNSLETSLNRSHSQVSAESLHMISPLSTPTSNNAE
ncbi:MAG: hypothetical protein ACLQVD_22865 [Capsulimonadaceae bacterium]